MPDGGLVPKTLYFPTSEQDSLESRAAPFVLDGLYMTSLVVKDFPHEVSASPCLTFSIASSVCIYLAYLQVKCKNVQVYDRKMNTSGGIHKAT